MSAISEITWAWEPPQTEFNSFFEQAPVGLAQCRLSGQVIATNPALQRILHLPLQTREEPNLVDLIAVRDSREAEQELLSLLAGKRDTVQFAGNADITNNASLRWTLWRVPARNGEAGSVLAMVEEIRRSPEVQERLQQAARLESLGRLAAGVAHDFNNLLTAILGYADLLLDGLPTLSPLRPDLEEIRKAANRAGALTRQLLAFSRKQVLEMRVLDLNELVADMDKMLRRLLGEDIDVLTKLDPALGAVRADAGQLEQVIVNLAVNARDAMPDGGRLTIETRNTELDDSYVREHVPVQPGRYVMLAVSDTGTGMSAETMSHVFEPFFTTKEPGKGTGLGLATVYGIVKQSGGYVWCYSERGEGGGTTFKVYLPRVDAPVDQLPARVPLPRTPGSETILLVEDEASLRALTRRLLERHGYMVLEAGSADAALALAREHVGPIHLLLADVVLPGASGPTLADELLSRCADLKVLFMSGYTEDAIVHRGVLAPNTAFINKPFSAEGLAAKVREVLDGS